jgi:hypothetical protein
VSKERHECVRTGVCVRVCAFVSHKRARAHTHTHTGNVTWTALIRRMGAPVWRATAAPYCWTVPLKEARLYTPRLSWGCARIAATARQRSDRPSTGRRTWVTYRRTWCACVRERREGGGGGEREGGRAGGREGEHREREGGGRSE